jgi:putative addiction module component (TIGR02574 family)
MGAASQRVRDEALSLSEDERAELAADLLASLAPPDPRSEQAWIAEIERRARAALAGEPGVPWDEARRQIEERLKR